MSSNPREFVAQGEGVTLIMQVALPDGIQEFYLGDGMTIGRSQACDVCLGQDTQVERMHARVVVADGIMRVLGLGSKSWLSTGSMAAKELILTDGVRFRIGSTDFSCIKDSTASSFANVGDHEWDRDASKALCPHCHAAVADPEVVGFIDCDGCGQHILLVNQESDNIRIALPSQFQSYRLQRFLCRLPGALLFAGHDQTQKSVIIKVLEFPKGFPRVAFERLRKEVSRLRRVDHPNVGRLLNAGSECGFNCCVFQAIGGRGLTHFISAAQAGPRPAFMDSLPWLIGICEGLNALHSVGIVHGNLRPSCILIDEHSIAKVVDIGIVKSVDEDGDLACADWMREVQEYWAPEQLATPSSLDARTDLYSLGVVAHELLTGERPQECGRQISKLNRTVPIDFVPVLVRLLALAREERYSTAAELLVDLRSFGAQSDRDQLIRVTSPHFQDLPTNATAAESSVAKESYERTLGRHLARVIGFALSGCGVAVLAARGVFVDVPQNARVTLAIACFVIGLLLRMYVHSKTPSAVPPDAGP